MLGRANCELLTPAIKECRLVSVCLPTARSPPITCPRQPRRAPFTGQLAHSLCATNRNCNASRDFFSILRESRLPFSKNDYNSDGPHTSLDEAHPSGVRK